MKYEEAKAITQLLIDTQMLPDNEGDKYTTIQLLIDCIEKDTNGDYTVINNE